MASNVKSLAAEGRSRASSRQSNDYDMVLGPKCRVNGTLECEGRARIDGIIEGEVRSVGELVVGEGAKIKAKIVAKKARIYGRVVGDISCTNYLELCSGASVSGNIVSPRLVMEEGVVFEGYCMMHEAQRLVQDEEKRRGSEDESQEDNSERKTKSAKVIELGDEDVADKVVDIGSGKS